MTALNVFTYGDTLVVSSETVASGSGVEHRAVLQLIHNNLSDFEEFGQVAFQMRPGYNNAPVRSALLNEQQATLLMTFQRNTDQVRAFKKALVRAFFEVAGKVAPALTSDQIVQQALQIMVERTASLEAKVAADAPKVLFADSVAASKTTILVGELAKILRGNGAELGQNRLFELLREDGYLIKRRGSDRNMPTQYSMELELFEIKETAVTHSDGHVTVSKTPKVTGKGQTYFVNRYAPITDLAVA